MKTNLFIWLMLVCSLGFSQQITLDTSLVSDKEGVIEEFWYWSGGFPVLGQGFAPNSEVTVFATDPNGTPWRDFTGTSDANGNFSIQISAKKITSVLGEHIVTATDGTNTVTAGLTVIANLRETLNTWTAPSQITIADFSNEGLTIKSTGLESNAEVKVHIFSPNESGSEITPSEPKFANAQGEFEMDINIFTPSYPWGESMPEVPGKWRVSVNDFSSSNTAYGQGYFRVLPENASTSNYCSIEQVINGTETNGVYPITSFEIIGAGTANNSSVTSDVYYEDFTETVLDVNAGETYTVRLKGKNSSSFAADTYTLFIDWNQNGILDEDNEIYNEGYIFNSTGTDDKFTEFQIVIPENAVSGNTRIRILKVNSVTTYSMYWPSGACGYYMNNGQVEDYTLNINGGITLPECSINCPEDITVEAESGTESVVVEYELAFDCEPSAGLCEVDYPGNNEYLIGIVSPIAASDFELPEGTVSKVTKIEANIVRAMFTASANLYFYEDNNGAPGELITSFQSIPYESQTESGTIGGFPVYKCVWELPQSIELEGGKYWLGLNIGGPLISWETTSTISNSTTLHTTFNSGSSWTPEEEVDGVFKVIYECAVDPTEETEIVLVDGLPSGAEFPIGTTTVIHNLVYKGVVIDTCTFDVTVEELMETAEFNSGKVALYPNPVRDMLNISSEKEISNIIIFDLSGKQVYTQSINNKQMQINVSHLATGIYIVKANVNEEVKTFKIVKK